MLDIDERNDRNKPLQQFKASFNLFRGVMYLIVAYFAYTTPYVTHNLGKTTVIFFSLFCLIYGLFRIYRSAVEYLQTLKK